MRKTLNPSEVVFGDHSTDPQTLVKIAGPLGGRSTDSSDFLIRLKSSDSTMAALTR